MSSRLIGYRLKTLLLLLIVGGVFSSFALSFVAWAQDASTVTTSDEERYQANLRRWQSMTEEQRQAIRDQAAAMPEADRAALQEKAKEYRAMPEQNRETLRENFQKFRALPPERREALEEGSRGFRQLPLAKRDEMRRRVQEQRRVQDGQGQVNRPGMDAIGVRPQGAPRQEKVGQNLENQSGPQNGPGERPDRGMRPGPQGQGRPGPGPDDGMRGGNGNNPPGQRPGPSGKGQRCGDQSHPCLNNGSQDGSASGTDNSNNIGNDNNAPGPRNGPGPRKDNPPQGPRNGGQPPNGQRPPRP